MARSFAFLPLVPCFVVACNSQTPSSAPSPSTASGATSTPAEAGKVSWAEGYPKAVPAAANEVKGAVELFGSYEVNPGWALKEAQFSFTSSQGGEISKPVELQFAGGKWGRLDAKDKTKEIGRASCRE